MNMLDDYRQIDREIKSIKSTVLEDMERVCLLITIVMYTFAFTIIAAFPFYELIFGSHILHDTTFFAIIFFITETIKREYKYFYFRKKIRSEEFRIDDTIVNMMKNKYDVHYNKCKSYYDNLVDYKKHIAKTYGD